MAGLARHAVWLLMIATLPTCRSDLGRGAPVPGFDTSVPPGDPPRIPIGVDALRYWERWPFLRIGARAYLRSTYDRAGGNEAADASHYLRERAPGDEVALDVAGPGVLYFTRANRWHGSPWTYRVDGRDFVVSESSTASPDAPVTPAFFFPPSAFPAPLALTWPETRGADVSWVPVEFRDALSIAHGRTFYGTGYFLYATYDPASALSHPIGSWDTSQAPPEDVLDLLARAGTDIAPTGGEVQTDGGTVAVPQGGVARVVELTGARTIRALRLSAPADAAPALSSATIRITWDDRALPSVDSPIPLFFGAGTLYNRNDAEYLVKSLPASVRFAGGNVELSSYFPMPFQRRARVEIVGGDAAVGALTWSIRSLPYREPANHAGYLHATYRDHGAPTPGKDLVLLDTTTDEGGGDVCGHLVGTAFTFSDRAVLNTLEGDPRFFFDDSQTPQAQGTGTEEWGAGGDYFQNGAITTLPLAGHPVGAPDAKSAKNAEDQIESAYRFLLSDLFPFGKNARVQLEHGGTDESVEHYRSTTFWYALPGACLVPTDALHVGDAADESAHGYASPDASAVETVTSRYEWGVDHVGDTEIYPATTDTGRHTTGASEFTIAIRPDNFGVLLRRKLDYAFADQRAHVFVADDAPGAAFADAGTWYLAGSSSCAFVAAKSETGVAPPVIQTSNRRWRDDEFVLSRALTRGRSRLRIRVVFEAAPAGGVPSPPSAWSEYRYSAYSFVLPPAP